MFHNNRHDVIESDDIQDVIGVHVTEENGHKVATIKAILDPRKDFLAIKEIFVHLSNGVNHRMFGPLAPAENLPVAQPSEVSTEVAQPSVEAQPAVQLGPDVKTSDATVQIPAVTPRKEKGN